MAEVRVHELARELGVTSKQVLVALEECGEFVKSASSEVRPIAAQQVRQRFTDSRPPSPPVHPASVQSMPTAPRAPAWQPPAIGFRAPRPTPPAGTRGVRARDAVRSGDAALTEAERLLGAEPGSTPRAASGEAAFIAAERALGAEPGSTPRSPSQHGRQPRHRNPSSVPHPPSRPRPRRGALTAEVADRWQLRADAARELSEHWLTAFIAADGELPVLRAFWSAGFGRGHHTLVLQCLQEGIRPEDLTIRIDGRRIGEAILGGVPVRLLARQLRDRGQLPSSTT